MKDLLEKLMDERELDPQSAMIKRYGKVTIKQLPPTRTEDDVVAVWLMYDGTMVPVEYTHDKDVKEIGLSVQEFLSTGALAVEVNHSYMSLRGEAGYMSDNQKDVVYRLWLKYQSKELVTDYQSFHISTKQELMDLLYRE